MTKHLDYDSMDTIGEFEFGGPESELESNYDSDSDSELNEHSNQSNEQGKTGNRKETKETEMEEEEPDVDVDESDPNNTISVGRESINLSKASPEETNEFIKRMRRNRLIRGDLDSYYRVNEPSVKPLTEEEQRIKEERTERNIFNTLFCKTQPEIIDLVSDTENSGMEVETEKRSTSTINETRRNMITPLFGWTPTQNQVDRIQKSIIDEERDEELKRTGESRKELPAKNKYIDKPISIDLSSSGEEEPVIQRDNRDDPLKNSRLFNELKELLGRVNTPERKEEEVGKEANTESLEEEVSEMVLYDESSEEEIHDEPIEKPQFEEREKVYEDSLPANNHEHMVSMEPELPFMRRDREIVVPY